METIDYKITLKLFYILHLTSVCIQILNPPICTCYTFWGSFLNSFKTYPTLPQTRLHWTILFNKISRFCSCWKIMLIANRTCLHYPRKCASLYRKRWYIMLKMRYSESIYHFRIVTAFEDGRHDEWCVHQLSVCVYVYIICLFDWNFLGLFNENFQQCSKVTVNTFASIYVQCTYFRSFLLTCANKSFAKICKVIVS